MPPLIYKFLLGLFSLLIVAACWPAKCNIINTTTLNFGIYDPFNPNATSSSGSITVACKGNAKYSITASKGFSNNFHPRKMKSADDWLEYNLYLDPALTIIWGDGTAGTQMLTGRGRQPVTYTIYGRIPARQDIGVGNYSDIIFATVDF